MALPRRPFPVPHLPGQGLLTSCDAAVYGGKGIKKCWIFHIEVLVQRRVRQCEPPRQQLQLVYNSKNYDLWIFRNHKYSVVYKQFFFYGCLWYLQTTYHEKVHAVQQHHRPGPRWGLALAQQGRLRDSCRRCGHLRSKPPGIVGAAAKTMAQPQQFIVIFHIDVSKISSIELVTLK